MWFSSLSFNLDFYLLFHENIILKAVSRITPSFIHSLLLYIVQYQWWNLTNCTNSRLLLYYRNFCREYSSEVLYFNIFIWNYFILLLHYISERNIVLFTALHFSESFSCMLLCRFCRFRILSLYITMHNQTSVFQPFLVFDPLQNSSFLLGQPVQMSMSC